MRMVSAPANWKQSLPTMDGWEAESDAATLLKRSWYSDDRTSLQMMKRFAWSVKRSRFLLAQALFGNPDILLLDEPTNHLDLDAITLVRGVFDQL